MRKRSFCSLSVSAVVLSLSLLACSPPKATSKIACAGGQCATDGGSPVCAHPLCSRGGALDQSCDPCVAQICAGDSYCCEHAWSSICVEEVASICGQTCDRSDPQSCGHSLCAAGGKLEPSCDPCVARICAQDSYCCTHAWSAICVDEVASVCGQSCGGGDGGICDDGGSHDGGVRDSGAADSGASDSGIADGGVADAGVSDGGAAACAHPLCSAGALLQASCDPCVAKICAADDYCCTHSWSSICVKEVGSTCGQSCGSDGGTPDGGSAGGTVGSAPTSDNPNVALGYPGAAPGTTPIVISRAQYVISWSLEHRELNWVAWRLSAADMGSTTRTDSFAIDPDLENYLTAHSEGEAVQPSDFTGSCFDRGHQIPSADRTDSDADNRMTFLMSNMIPQTAFLNRVIWEHLESYERTLAKVSTVYIFAGPVYGTTIGDIGPKHDIAIPSEDFKIIVQPATIAGAAPTITAVLMPNVTSTGTDPVQDPTQTCTDSKKLVTTNNADDWKQYEVPLSTIEKATGLDFEFLNTPVAPAPAPPDAGLSD